MVKEYSSKCLPQSLQELDSLHHEAVLTIQDSIQGFVDTAVSHLKHQTEHLVSISKGCKAISLRKDIDRFVNSRNPDVSHMHHVIQTFKPELTSPATPVDLTRCRIIHEKYNETALNDKKQQLSSELLYLESYVKKTEDHLIALGQKQLQIINTEAGHELYDLQLEACKKRNELNFVNLKMSVLRSQLASINSALQQNGLDSSSGGTDKPKAKEKSVKTMWKKLAFRAGGLKSASSKSVDSGMQITSPPVEKEISHGKQDVREANGRPLDPIYGHLKNAAALRKTDANTKDQSSPDDNNVNLLKIELGMKDMTIVPKTQPVVTPRKSIAKRMKSSSLDTATDSHTKQLDYGTKCRSNSYTYNSTPNSNMPHTYSNTSNAYSQSPKQGSSTSLENKVPHEQKETNGLEAVILYDFYPQEPGDLLLRAGDRVNVLEKTPSGWWLGEVSGHMGYFPSRYARFVESGQRVYQVLRPVSLSDIHLAPNQIVLGNLIDDNEEKILVNVTDNQTGKNGRIPVHCTHLKLI